MPLSDVSSTRGEDRQSGGCVVGAHGKVELCIVSVLVVLNAVIGDGVSHWTAVDDEQ